jgi:hypothetical protein
MQRLRLSSFLLAGGVALALAGCGGSPSALRSVRAAARDTLSQGVELTLTLHGASLSGSPIGTALGAAAFALPRGEGLEALDLPPASGQVARAHLVFLPDGVDVAPAVDTLLPRGASWIDASLAGPGAAPAPGLAALLEGLNPQLLLDEVAWGATSASARGQQVIAHVPYSRYRVVVDLSAALSGATGPAAGAIAAALRDELAAGASRVELTVWIDGPGRLARLQAAVPGSRLGTVEMVLSNFGATVPVSLPLGSELVDIAALAPGAHPTFVLSGRR